MRPFSALLPLLAALFAVPACAQPAPAPQAATQDADPALWVAKKGKATIYLFGTVHVLKPGLTWFDEAVRKAFDASDTLVLEMVSPPAEEMQAIVTRIGIAPPSAPPLSEAIPAEKREAYIKTLTGLGYPGTAFDRLKPWYASVNLTVLPLVKLGYDLNSGPEKVLADAAQAAKKPVVGLETAEQQLGYFDSLTPQAQMSFLTATVDQQAEIDSSMLKMVDLWGKGDVAALTTLINKDITEMPEVEKMLLLDRNARWAATLAERAKAPGTTFVAVGAAHLDGKGSVVDLLGRYGLKVTRVKY